jgi:hypothetical protein
MKMSKTSQNAKILAYMKKGNTLTALGALNLFGCFRLAARVKNLKDAGHVINTEMIVVGLYGEEKRIARYRLILQTDLFSGVENGNT